MRKLLLITCFVLTSFRAQADLLKDFDTLGGNDVLMNRAKVLQPDKDVKVVQNRTVDRRWRNELSLGYVNVIGGDAYLETQMLNLDYHLHITPHWTVGLSYFSAFNKLSKEADFMISNKGLIPDVDQPESGTELLGNFAPIYGKINMFDLGVLQFDIYGLATLGVVTLKSGSTNTYSVGAGLGLWISQHLTARMEIRQRFYEAQRFGGATNIDTTVAGVSFGYML